MARDFVLYSLLLLSGGLIIALLHWHLGILKRRTRDLEREIMEHKADEVRRQIRTMPLGDLVDFANRRHQDKTKTPTDTGGT